LVEEAFCPLCNKQTCFEIEFESLGRHRIRWVNYCVSCEERGDNKTYYMEYSMKMPEFRHWVSMNVKDIKELEAMN
jgi:hypothetical protein